MVVQYCAYQCRPSIIASNVVAVTISCVTILVAIFLIIISFYRIKKPVKAKPDFKGVEEDYDKYAIDLGELAMKK